MTRLTTPFLVFLVTLPVLSASCAGSRATREETAPTPTAAQETAKEIELRRQVETLQSKLDGMETKLVALSDKLDAARTSLETLRKNGGGDSDEHEVKSSPVDTVVTSTPDLASSVKKLAQDPDAGFSTELPIQVYRKAMVLFDSGRHSESILAFSQFLDQYADHPWAGSAQYHIGLSYVAQKEFKLAIQEFNRVLTSYDRSPHVPDSLNELARCEDALKLSKQASQHRQMLLSLYPNSPAAASLRKWSQSKSQEPPSEPVNAPAPATAPVPTGVKEEHGHS